MERISGRNWALLLVLGLIWGSAFMFVSLSLRDAGPMTVTAVRICLGALFLLGVSFYLGSGLPSLRSEGGPRIWRFAVGMGLLSSALPFAFLAWGQQTVASGFAGVCMAVVPLFVLPMAHFAVPEERLTRHRLAGFLLGTLGVVVLVGPEAFVSTGADLEGLSRLACVVAAGCYALGAVCTKLCPDVDRLALSAAALLVSSAFILPVALIYEGIPGGVTLTGALSMVFLGVLSTGLTQWILVVIIRDAGPVFLTIVNYKVPVWATIFGVLILDERLPPSLYLGMALILVGVAISQATALRALFRGEA